MTSSIIAVVAAATIVIIAPGPDSLLVLRNTMRGGTPSGWATAVGVLTGLATWAVLPAGVPARATSLLLGVLFVLETALWFAVLLGLSARAAGVLQRPEVQLRVQRFAGVVLVGFGIRLATQTR